MNWWSWTKVGIHLLLFSGAIILYYERYWRWRDCFTQSDRGLCHVFDGPDAGVYYEIAGVVYPVIACLFLTFLLLNVRKVLSRMVG